MQGLQVEVGDGLLAECNGGLVFTDDDFAAKF